MPLSIVILAAGQGTRMKSARPKVLHQLAGKPLLQHVVDAGRALDAGQVIVVVGHGAAEVRAALDGQNLVFVDQHEQLGTGHALKQCLGAIDAGNDVLVLAGDVPLIRTETLAGLCDGAGDCAVCLLSFIASDPFGYGRVVRDKSRHVRAIVEQRDTDNEIARIAECNSGVMLIRGNRLPALLDALENDNDQGEYYLTDVVGHAVEAGDQVEAIVCEDPEEVSGVNDQLQLAAVESVYRTRKAAALMKAGVKICDPARIDIRGEIDAGRDVEIDVNCIFEGTVVLGDGVHIGANCVIRNSTIAAGSKIRPMTWIDEAEIGRQVEIGPFARIRPGTALADHVRIGNFVETKKAEIGEGSKVNHLSYVGDTEMGSGVNIGAGTITCNYDGVNKSKTVIEDGVFVGSDTQLVAPVTIRRNATIGAGSTITKDAPAEKLTLTRARQTTIESWSRPRKKDT